MLADVGRIIARRRTALALDVDGLAAKADVSAAHVTALEAGEAGATTVELERLAAFLELDHGALLTGQELDRAQPSIFLRHHSNPDFDAGDLPVLDGALAQGRALRALCRLLRMPPASSRPLSQAGANPARQGYMLARELRTALRIGGDPLEDARAFAEERFETAVLVRPLSSLRVTALSMRTRDGAAIVLNELDPDRRKNPALARVHIAHELCHLLHDRSDGGLHLVVDVALDRRELAAEQRARGFAAELLLPEQGLKARFGQPKAIQSLTEARAMIEEARGTWGTPNEIAANHLTNLNFIDPDLREALLVGAAAVTVPETRLPSSREPSIRVQTLIQQAHIAGLVTDGQARDVLGLDLVAPLPWDDE